MKSLVEMNAFRCRMWDLHDRLEDHISEETCKAEILSVERHGQLVPVLGRLLERDPHHDVELIYGARRLFVARHLNKPLLVDLRENLSDREAIVAMDIENRQRADISPYERGLSYARMLRAGYFQSQDDLAKALKVSSSQVSRLLKLARLPTVVVDAFSSPAEICENWGLALAETLSQQSKRLLIVNRARAMAEMAPRAPAREVFRTLMAAAAAGRKLRSRARDEVVKDSRGAPLFRIRQQTESIAVLLPIEKISARTMDRIRLSVADILQSSTGQITDSTGRFPAVTAEMSTSEGGATARV